MHSAYMHALDQLCRPIRSAAYAPSLDALYRLLSALDNPHLNLNAVVVAGSTGKGTTASHLAQLLQASGQRIGLYTSPHLHIFRERFSINSELITPQAFTTCATQVLAAAQTLNHTYSTFELATALALVWFRHQHTEIAVLEVGIGGRWDAVNTVPNILALFTPIELEHTAMLGHTLPEIAQIKAGIIQPGGHALTLPQSPQVTATLQDTATAQNATLVTIADHLAQAAWHSLNQRNYVTGAMPAITPHSLPGRQEWVTHQQKQYLIDGGHTPAAAAHLRHTIETHMPPDAPVHLTIGMLGDKNSHDYLHTFDQPRYHITLTQAPGHRAVPPQQLQAAGNFQHATVTLQPDLNTALYTQPTQESLHVIAGSLRMVTAAREAFGLLSDSLKEEATFTHQLFAGAQYLQRVDGPPGTAPKP